MRKEAIRTNKVAATISETSKEVEIFRKPTRERKDPQKSTVGKSENVTGRNKSKDIKERKKTQKRQTKQEIPKQRKKILSKDWWSMYKDKSATRNERHKTILK